MTALSKILVVLDPTRMVQPALNKAEEVATLSGADLHLYCCLESSRRADPRDHSLDDATRWLERLAGSSRELGLKVSVTAESSSDWRQAIVEMAARDGCDLVVKSASQHLPMRRVLLKSSDWLLLGNCPCSMLFVKTERPWSKRKVLAAVKITPEGETHRILNNGVLKVGRQVADTLQSEMHAVTVYNGDDAWFDRQVFADKCELPRDRIHANEGRPQKAISQVADELDADILVIGTVSESDAAGGRVGHTAEKIIDEIGIDVLALPPLTRRAETKRSVGVSAAAT